SAEIIATVAERIRRWGLDRVVVDPVMVAKSGDRLLKADAVAALVRDLLPLALVVTPNLPEAEVLVGRSLKSVEDIHEAARAIVDLGPRAVVTKGGHRAGDATEPTDVDARHEIFSCPGVTANTLQLPWRSTEFTRERFGQARPDSYGLVAVVDGRVVGNLGLHIVQTARRRDVGALGMSVHDAFQNRGIGSALMAAMVELADN